MKNRLNDGEGMWLWIVSRYMGGNVDAIVEEFKRARFRYVIIKIADWAVRYNEASMKTLVSKLKQNNIEPWGWQYIYGNNPALEAEVAAKFANELGLYGFVINAEKEFVGNTAMKSAAKTYIAKLKQILDPDMLVGLSSYRYPYRYFLNYPWKEFLSGCDFYAPQVYWMGTQGVAGRQLEESLADVEKMYMHFGIPRLPIRPTGACFSEHGWKASLGDIIAFKEKARQLGLRFIDWWEAGNAKSSVPDGYEHIFTHPYLSSTPLPPPVIIPGEALYAAQVTASALTIRSGPTSKSSAVGYLSKGDRVSIYGVSGNWGRIHATSSRWVSLQYVSKVAGTVDLPNPLYSASVKAWALNVRAEPVIGNNIVGSLKRNDRVSVFEENAGWVNTSPSAGRWVSANWIVGI